MLQTTPPLSAWNTAAQYLAMDLPGAPPSRAQMFRHLRMLEPSSPLVRKGVGTAARGSTAMGPGRAPSLYHYTALPLAAVIAFEYRILTGRSEPLGNLGEAGPHGHPRPVIRVKAGDAIGATARLVPAFH